MSTVIGTPQLALRERNERRPQLGGTGLGPLVNALIFYPLTFNAFSRRPFLSDSERPSLYRLRLLQRRLAIQRFRPKPAGRDVIPIEEWAGPIVRKSDLKAAAPWHGFVFDEADMVCHLRRT